jgi:hypothetical protein
LTGVGDFLSRVDDFVDGVADALPGVGISLDRVGVFVDRDCDSNQGDGAGLGGVAGDALDVADRFAEVR